MSGPSIPDENDRLRAGTLPADPEADATPFSPPPALPPDSRAVAALQDENPPLDGMRVGCFLDDAVKRMEARATGTEKPITLPWPALGEALAGGLWPGLHVLVGNTGSGKSQFSLQIAVEAASAGVPVLYVGLELGKVDLVARLLGLLTRRRWSRLFLGTGGLDELRELRSRHADAFTTLAEMPFHLDVCPPMGWSYTELTHKTRALRALYPELRDATGAPIPGSRPLLVVLDFLQLVGSPSDVREDLRERIGRAAYAGRAVARDLDAAVLLVSSTARDNYGKVDGEKDGSKGPALGEGNPARFVGLGKESGEVEYAADTVLVLCRDTGSTGRAPEDGWSPMWLAIAKSRARGDTPEAQRGWVDLRFNGGRFEAQSPSGRRVSL